MLATVACGLYLSWNGPRLISSATRLQGIFFCDLLVYLVEGLVFLLTGLQARTLIDDAHLFSIHDLLIATAWTTLIVIAAALGQPVARETRSVAAVARAVHNRFHRRTRRDFAGRSARNSSRSTMASPFRIAT